MRVLLLEEEKPRQWSIKIGDLVNSNDIIVLVSDCSENKVHTFSGVCISAPLGSGSWPGKYLDNWLRDKFTYFPNKLMIEND